MIFDTHCHLNDPELYKDIDTIIKSAHESGVERFLVVGYDYQSSILAVEISNKYKECFAAVGIHPSEVSKCNKDDINKIEKLLTNNKVIAVGEIGLDYYWDKEQTIRDLQKEYFIKQIELSNKYNLPIVVHNRDAIEDCLNILRNNKPIKRGIIHCFGGSVESMKETLKLGLYIGIGGVVTFTNAKVMKDVVKEAPLEYIVSETDCPYLTPHPYRGQRNEPKYISLVIDKIAEIKDVDRSIVEKTLYNNANKLFNL